MVLFLSTWQLWLIIIGVTVLVVLLLLFAGYMYLRKAAKKKQVQHYTIERISRPSTNSVIEISEIYQNFSRPEKTEKLLPDPSGKNLEDSTDLTSKFNKSVLRLNSEYADVNQRVSTGSMRTCYSANVSRTNSKCSFTSCFEDSGDV